MESQNSASGPARNIVQAGHIAGDVHFHQAAFKPDSCTPRTTAAEQWPRRIGRVPIQADSYQQREVDPFSSADRAAPVHVLVGMGGVGKTQLAADYAEQSWAQRRLDLLVWITADSRSAIVSGLARAAAEVGHMVGDSQDLDERAGRFLQWLATTSRRWLIVLDDVGNPGDLRGLWPPLTRTGKTLVTTRRRDAALAGGQRSVVNVGSFTNAEAAAYLGAKLTGHASAMEGASELADALGLLPLALAQAAAYLIDRNLSCADYLRRLNDRRRKLVDLAPDAGCLPDDHRTTMAATWSLSIEAADQLRPAGAARPLLEVLSLLDANGAPFSILTTSSVLRYLNSDNAVDAEDAWDALHCLQRFSLISVDPASERQVRIHALVQRATRDQMGPSKIALVTGVAAEALREVWPDVERDPDFARSLRANTAALRHHAELDLWRMDAQDVLFRAARSLGEAGFSRAAAEAFTSLHTAASAQLGPDHRDTLLASTERTNWLGTSGDIATAISGLQRALSRQIKALGADDSTTLSTRFRVLRWQTFVGKCPDVYRQMQELLQDHMRVLGPEHPDTLRVRHTLARVSRDRESYLQSLLADRVRVLGQDHPDTLATRSNLAFVRGEGGDFKRAVQDLEGLLRDQKRILHPQHPEVLATLANLAHWRGRGGDPEGALQTEEELLAHDLQTRDPDDPSVLVARNNVAHWHGEIGDARGAIEALETLLRDRLRIQGPDHPHTLTNRYNIAHWHGQAGDPSTAAGLLRVLLSDMIRALGPGHGATLNTRRELAHWLARAGHLDAASVTLDELLTEQIRQLGDQHPDTVLTRDEIARSRQDPECRARPPRTAWPEHRRKQADIGPE